MKAEEHSKMGRTDVLGLWSECGAAFWALKIAELESDGWNFSVRGKTWDCDFGWVKRLRKSCLLAPMDTAYGGVGSSRDFQSLVLLDEGFGTGLKTHGG